MQAIARRIKEMDIQDCKVRVTNVDSQESNGNIVVQVIGEMSLKSAPHRKFTQTFILAPQFNGYFVLNDIFRYLIEEEEEEYPPEPAAEPGLTPQQPAEAEAATVPSSEGATDQQRDISQVDKKLEEEVPATASEPAEAPLPNGVSQSSDVVMVEDSPVAAVTTEETEDTPAAEPAAEAAATEDLHVEKPQDPDPTPIASPPKPAKAAPAPPAVPTQPPKPAAPRTWATLVANSKNSSTPATSTPTSSTSQTPAAQTRPAPPAQPTNTATATSPNDTRKPQANGNPPAGWQTQEGARTRQGRQQSMSGPMQSKDTVLGYVKNVNDKVDASLLKQTLATFGKLAYFDVSRPKVRLTDFSIFHSLLPFPLIDFPYLFALHESIHSTNSPSSELRLHRVRNP